jgi:hypothetical protein
MCSRSRRSRSSATNPLEASLSVKAKSPGQYGAIVDWLTSQNLAPGNGSIVDRINYFQNKTVIDRLTAAIAPRSR